MNLRKSICVIGAGPSGLCTIKELKECGHDVTCYDKSCSIGGAFSTKSVSSKVYDSLLLTVSNFFMAYSGFPVNPTEGRRYWNAYEYEQYLIKYCKEFGLLENISFETTVVNVEKKADSYHITTKDKSNNVSEKVFDAVVICTGTNRVPRVPQIEGAEDFQGKIIHTEEYTNANDFKGKKVVCVGVGESGADIAHEIANEAEECTLIMRSLPSIVPRWISQHTNDGFTSRSFHSLGKHGMNRFMQLKGRWALATKRNLSSAEKLHLEWLSKNPRYFNRFLTKNDVFIEDIVNNKLACKQANIARIEKDSICLTDGTKIKADVIVLNTGYKEDFGILGSCLKIDNVRNLFKHMIHPDIGPSFSLIGWARPAQGGVPACSEMQARYLALLLAGKKTLPLKDDLLRQIKSDKEWEEDFFDDSSSLNSLVDYHRFMVSLAKLIGCYPRISRFLSPKLSYKMWFGSHIANSYRIDGPGSMRKESIHLIKSLPVSASRSRNLVVSMLALVYGKKANRSKVGKKTTLRNQTS